LKNVEIFAISKLYIGHYIGNNRKMQRLAFRNIVTIQFYKYFYSRTKTEWVLLRLQKRVFSVVRVWDGDNTICECRVLLTRIRPTRRRRTNFVSYLLQVSKSVAPEKRNDTNARREMITKGLYYYYMVLYCWSWWK